MTDSKPKADENSGELQVLQVLLLLLQLGLLHGRQVHHDGLLRHDGLADAAELQSAAVLQAGVGRHAGVAAGRSDRRGGEAPDTRKGQSTDIDRRSEQR